MKYIVNRKIYNTDNDLLLATVYDINDVPKYLLRDIFHIGPFGAPRFMSGTLFFYRSAIDSVHYIVVRNLLIKYLTAGEDLVNDQLFSLSIDQALELSQSLFRVDTVIRLFNDHLTEV